MSVLLTSRSSAAGSITSVAGWRLLPLSPPAGFSTLLVAMWALLLTLRWALPGWKWGRSTRLTLPSSWLARVPTVQLKVGAAGVIWLPAATEQVAPALLGVIDTTLKPVSPGAKLKLSSTATFSAVDGPLFLNSST